MWWMHLCRTLVAVVLALAGSAHAADLYVAPDGDDAGPGTRARPLATFDGARRTVRRHVPRGREPMTVHVAAGTYYLPGTVVFTAADSGTAEAPVTYAAAEGAEVVISGGQKIDLDWKPYRGGIMQAAVPEGFTFDQLFVGGRRQPMARYPNYDPEAQYFQGFAADCISPERVRRWADPSGGFLHAMHPSLWGDMHWRITGRTAEGKLEMEGGWQNNRRTGPHKKYRFVENVFEELDAPGEWYLDADKHVLYFYP
ncbi:MAG: signaling protein, partial [Planctomycetota bacterium]|nr:signaling protein [Planctomycetota bacterium]